MRNLKERGKKKKLERKEQRIHKAKNKKKEKQVM